VSKTLFLSFKKTCLWVKKPCFGGFWGQKQGFPNIPNLRKIWNLFYSKLSKNYKKMMLKLNFGNHEKLVPTFGMQGLTSSLVGNELVPRETKNTASGQTSYWKPSYSQFIKRKYYPRLSFGPHSYFLTNIVYFVVHVVHEHSMTFKIFV